MARTRSYHHGDLKNALIAAGASILNEEGTSALSLRRVAQRAGVTHSAPYAHFPDKQALIAAIATDGYSRLYEALQRVAEEHADNPARQLVEGAWAYVQFGTRHPDSFKVTMSGIVEREMEYPAHVDIAKRNFGLLVRIVERCQGAGVLQAGASDLVALTVWSVIHGFVTLLLENQLPRAVTDVNGPRAMLLFMLDRMATAPLPRG